MNQRVAIKPPTGDGTYSSDIVLDYLAAKGFTHALSHPRRRTEAVARERVGRHKSVSLELPDGKVSATASSTRLLYSSRAMAFVGRQQELRDLLDFASDDHELLWWLWTGPGGSGKSRIALEFCHSLSDAWEVGFLPYSSNFREWKDWQPDRATLIIIDYCSTRARESGAFIDSLSMLRLEHPVRILLLERERRSPWWTDFLHAESATTRNRILQSQYKQPHELSPLEDESLWELVDGILNEASVRVDADKSSLLEELRSIDPLGRPLFAALAAEALTDGANIRQWNQQQLVENVLSREEERWRSALKTALSRDVLVEQYLNLVALVTVVGGLPLESALAWLTEAPLTGLLPPAADFHPETYERLFEPVGASSGVPPVEPDIVGEAFVLERLGSSSAPGRVAGLMQHCWKHNPSATASFVTRAVLDFPTHDRTAALLEPPALSSRELIWWSVSLVNCAGTLAIQSLGVFEELTTRLSQVSEKSPRENLLRQHLAMAYFDAAIELLHNESFTDAYAYLIAADELSGLPAELRSDIRYNLGLSAYGLGKAEEAIEAFSKVVSSESTPQDLRGRSLHNRAVVYLEEGQRDEALKDFSNLVDASWVPPNLKLDGLDHLRLVQASVSISKREIDLYGPSTRFGGLGTLPQLVALPHLLTTLYEDLKQMADRVAERSSTMEADDLVQEVYIRLWRLDQIDPVTEERFFALASTAMRRILVDDARRARAQRRGETRLRVELSEVELPAGQPEDVEILDLDAALRELSRLDERSARVVELRFFGGMTLGEIAQAIGVSKSTVHGQYRYALARLRSRLGA